MAQPGFALVNIAYETSPALDGSVDTSTSKFVTIKDLKDDIEVNPGPLAKNIYIWTGRTWALLAARADNLATRQGKIIPTEFPVTNVLTNTTLGMSNVYSYGSSSSCVYLGTTSNGLTASQAAHPVSKILDKSYKTPVTSAVNMDVGLDSSDITGRVDRSPLGYAKGSATKGSTYDLGKRNTYCLTISSDTDGVFWCNGTIVDTDTVSLL
jgi:hypothetical protein